MPGRQEFGVLDIKAEPLGLAMPSTQMWQHQPGAKDSLGSCCAWSQSREPQMLPSL